MGVRAVNLRVESGSVKSTILGNGYQEDYGWQFVEEAEMVLGNFIERLYLAMVM